MLCCLLLIVLFASAQAERCPKIENVPQCTEDEIPCPGSKYENGCPTTIVCQAKWYEKDPDKTCTTACGDIKCKEDELKVSSDAITWFRPGSGQCDRMQEFCVKYDIWGADLGLVRSGVDKETTIAWPNSCAPEEKWLNFGFDEYGYWLGSLCIPPQ